MMVVQCVRIDDHGGNLMMLSARKGNGAHTPEGISRLPLCISGDGVLWCWCMWRRAVSRGKCTCDMEVMPVNRQVWNQRPAERCGLSITDSSEPASDLTRQRQHHRAPSIAALRAIPRADTGPRGRKRYSDKKRPWSLAGGDKPRNQSAGSQRGCGGNP